MNIEHIRQLIRKEVENDFEASADGVVRNKATEAEHETMMAAMRPFLDDEEPKIGIFWYDIQNEVLFGVEKDNAEKYIKKRGDGTLNKLHKTYWAKQHHRAKAKGLTNSIFYIENNYTLIPRGRAFVRPNGEIYVAVGKWFDGYIGGEKVLDTQKVRELIADEFNLPDDFEAVYDEHWDIGHGWSGDVLLLTPSK